MDAPIDGAGVNDHAKGTPGVEAAEDMIASVQRAASARIGIISAGLGVRFAAHSEDRTTEDVHTPKYRQAAGSRTTRRVI
jgi:hypothetical protein